MLDIKAIRENVAEFKKQMARRNFDSSEIDLILELDQKNREQITKIQELQKAKNDLAREIGAIKDKKSSEFSSSLQKANQVKLELLELESNNDVKEKLESLLYTVPNILSSDVPNGFTDEDNLELRKFSQPRKFNFSPKSHDELGEALGMMDFEQTAKISGSRFVTLKSNLARLERALASFMLDEHMKNGFTEYSPPYLVWDSAMFGAGQLPKFAEDSYSLNGGYRLIPTSEVSLVNFVADRILDPNELPLRLTAFTPCFRSEAGSAGKDTKGMIRLHQFNKVELVSVVTPDRSAEELEFITSCAENILKKLELPFRTILKCQGDTGFTAHKSYDLEVWVPSQNTYREISSCSNCLDFQARRMKARYRKTISENEFVHTLNGSGLAVGRTIVAILENYQQEDGSVLVPEVLRKYINDIDTISRIKSDK